jgi:predicted ribosomally synthesized peptide with SipW-like signal peptide
MSRTGKILKTLLVVGVVGTVAGVGSLSAFTSQADNTNNRITAGTVSLTDNDGGSAPLYANTNAKPGHSVTSCIQVSYGGSLAATVKLFTPSTIDTLGPHVNLKIEAGSQTVASFPDCTAFSADQTLFDAALSTFPTTYAAGIEDEGPAAATQWVNNDKVVYRVTATLSASAPDTAQAATTGLHTLRWEARNE